MVYYTTTTTHHTWYSKVYSVPLSFNGKIDMANDTLVKGRIRWEQNDNSSSETFGGDSTWIWQRAKTTEIPQLTTEFPERLTFRPDHFTALPEDLPKHSEGQTKPLEEHFTLPPPEPFLGNLFEEPEEFSVSTEEVIGTPYPEHYTVFPDPDGGFPEKLTHSYNIHKTNLITSPITWVVTPKVPEKDLINWIETSGGSGSEFFGIWNQ